MESLLAEILEELQSINEKLDKAPDVVYNVTVVHDEDSISKIHDALDRARGGQ